MAPAVLTGTVDIVDTAATTGADSMTVMEVNGVIITDTGND